MSDIAVVLGLGVAIGIVAYIILREINERFNALEERLEDAGVLPKQD